jgi:aspartate racemase
MIRIKPTSTSAQRFEPRYPPADESTGLLAASSPAEPSGPAEAESSRPPPRAALPRSRSVIGVMGGMHPQLANALGQKLIEKSGAQSDQEHARVLLDQAPVHSVLTAKASLQRLDRGGADMVAVACNTALGFFGEMQTTIDNLGLKLELLHIVDATMAELDKKAPGATHIGLLATTDTREAKIYETYAKPGMTWCYPSSETQAILNDPSSTPDVRRNTLLEEAKKLKENGAQAILVACPEISMLLKTGGVTDKKVEDLPLIDTLDALARQALKKATEKQSRLATPRGCFDIAAEGLTYFVVSASALINGTPERSRRVGVIGGMGPAAAMQFSSNMVKFDDRASADQPSVLMLLDQATDIPDRTGFILKVKDAGDPAPEIVASLKRLAHAGADEIVMTCNTAHHFFPKVQEAIKSEGLNVELIHIVDATMKLLDQQAPGAKKIGLLATSGTVDTGIYQKRAEGRTWMVPDKATQDGDVMPGIYQGVKAGNNEMGKERLLRAAQKLADDGAEAILLACTEIPLVLKTGDVLNPAGVVVPLIDTLEAQAREAIARSRVPVPATPGLVQQVCQWLAPQHAAATAEAIV